MYISMSFFAMKIWVTSTAQLDFTGGAATQERWFTGLYFYGTVRL